MLSLHLIISRDSWFFNGSQGYMGYFEYYIIHTQYLGPFTWSFQGHRGFVPALSIRQRSNRFREQLLPSTFSAKERNMFVCVRRSLRWSSSYQAANMVQIDLHVTETSATPGVDVSISSIDRNVKHQFMLLVVSQVRNSGIQSGIICISTFIFALSVFHP